MVALVTRFAFISNPGDVLILEMQDRERGRQRVIKTNAIYLLFQVQVTRINFCTKKWIKDCLLIISPNTETMM